MALRTNTQCSVAGCSKRTTTANPSPCPMHRQRLARTGTLEGIRPEIPVSVKFDAATPHRPEGGCWEWQGSLNAGGYGVLKSDAGSSAHRYSYTRFVGPIPPGLQVRHSCDNPRCVNPAHLSVGTNQDNVDDKMIRGRQPRGRDMARAKLDEDKVRQARRLFEDGASLSAIGRRFGVSAGAIENIVKGRTWRHVSIEVAS